MKRYDIFLCYRRESGIEFARPLALDLTKRGYHVFLDFKAIKDGRFDECITAAIDTAPIFVTILSPHCFDRCVNADDWMRQQIEYAIAHEKHIIPLNPDQQFEGFPETMPEHLRQALNQCQFAELTMGTRFKESMDKMVEDRIVPILGRRTRRDAWLHSAKQQQPEETAEQAAKEQEAAEQAIAEIEATAQDPTERAELLYELGAKYDEKEKYEQAAACFLKAAKMGFAKAQNVIGYYYVNGRGVPENKAKAFSWYHKAAKQGLASAQHNVGVCYQFGKGVAENKKKAVKWYEKAAKQDYADSISNLASCIQRGEGTPKDEKLAFILYEEAAKLGSVEGRARLGQCYANGIGTYEDKIKAKQLFQEAAEQGSLIAYFELQFMQME